MVTKCGACGDGPLAIVLSLGSSPPACSMRPTDTTSAEEPHYPLELLLCGRCSLVQLSCVVDPGLVFHPDYPYSSGNTQALHADFEQMVATTREVVDLKLDDLVVDIGANDGTLLGKFPTGQNAFGVDPTDQVKKCGDVYGIPFLQEFFTAEAARAVKGELGDAKVITACNVLAHVPDIHDVLEGVRILLAEGGVFVTENHDLTSIVEGLQWDTIYHEHLRFYTPQSFGALLEEHGMRVLAQEQIPTHGGSFRTFAAHRMYQKPSPAPAAPNLAGFAGRVAHSRHRIRDTLTTLRLKGHRVFGVGAAARATTVIGYCGLTRDDLECVCEVPSSDKIGHFMPGTAIPVVDERRLFEEQPDYAFLFSWHVANSIIPKLRERGYRGTFIVPLPELRLV